jgi:hypothetical protein
MVKLRDIREKKVNKLMLYCLVAKKDLMEEYNYEIFY